MEKIVPKLTSAEAGWALAGLGVVAGTLLIPKLPPLIGTYTSLIAGVILLVVSMRYIHEHSAAALGFGAGFALLLDGVIRLVMPSTATATASYLNITI